MFTLAMIHSAASASGQAPFDALPADGRQLSAEASANAVLYSIIENQFGGEVPNFLLPDLRGRAVIGAVSGFATPAHTVQMMWIMATESRPLPGGSAGIAAGMVLPFAGTAVPDGWVLCDGSLFTQAQYPELHALFGNAFGWLPGGQVALPRLPDTVVVGAGAPYAPGLPNTVVGTTIGGATQGLCLNYLICCNGVWPATGDSAIPAEQGFIGQIIAYAGNAAPPGWLFCDGALIAIESYEELYMMIQNSYGGDGITTFAAPDLRGKMLVGPSA
jgi:microcystin-dependent protein